MYLQTNINSQTLKCETYWQFFVFSLICNKYRYFRNVTVYWNIWRKKYEWSGNILFSTPYHTALLPTIKVQLYRPFIGVIPNQGLSISCLYTGRQYKWTFKVIIHWAQHLQFIFWIYVFHLFNTSIRFKLGLVMDYILCNKR